MKSRIDPEMNRQRIEALKDFLGRREWTQKKLANVLRMEVRQVNRWVNNKADVPYWLLMLIFKIEI